jgi:hypothetical protein
MTVEPINKAAYTTTLQLARVMTMLTMLGNCIGFAVLACCDPA